MAMLGNGDGIDVRDVATGRLLHSVKTPFPNGWYAGSEVLSSDGKLAVTITDGKFKAFSTANGKQVRTFDIPLLTSSIVFTPDSRRFVTVGRDRVMRLWDAVSGRELLRMVEFSNGEWVAITPEGYYKASAKGDQYLTVHIGDRVFGIAQWRKIFYNPQIVEAILRGGDAGKAISSVLGNQSEPITLASPNLPLPPTIEVKSAVNNVGSPSKLSLRVSNSKRPRGMPVKFREPDFTSPIGKRCAVSRGSIGLGGS
jgi:WD40 repeat protein